jgi:hypothetical protein
MYATAATTTGVRSVPALAKPNASLHSHRSLDLVSEEVEVGHTKTALAR